MTMTVRDVIKAALRKMGGLASGDDPTADEVTDALTSYNSLLRSMFGTIVGQRLSPQAAAASLTAEPGGQYQIAASAMTITLPANPKNGARVGVVDSNLNFAVNTCTVARNGRSLEGAAANLSLTTAGGGRTWFFRGDTGNWVREADQAIDDTVFFPDNLIAYLPDMLAVYIASEYGAEIRPDVVAKSIEGREAFKRIYSRRGRNQADAPLGAPVNA
jgi:hypothetical protein